MDSESSADSDEHAAPGPESLVNESLPQPAAEARSPESPPRLAIDWVEARRRAIEDLGEERNRSAAYRTFSFPGTLGEERAFDDAEQERRAAIGLQPPKTAFDSPSKGRAGFDEENALGQYVVWVTDDCYRTFGTNNLFILPIAQGLYDVPMTTCVRVQARGDLFENLKPSYLMSAPEREERAERLRRLDTGAIATFAD